MRALLAATLTSVALAVDMSSWGVGINLGNTLDAPNEGDWAPAAERVFFEDFASAGFSTVRIPVRWDEHMASAEPYAIDADFLDRIEEVVGWALDIPQLAHIIINAHHDDWLDTDDADEFAAALPRFTALWQQVAELFADADVGRLHFEVFNEPHVMGIDQLNAATAAMRGAVRAVSPERAIIVAGLEWSDVYWLADHPDALAVDFYDASGARDEHVLLEVHNYAPENFTWAQGRTAWGSPDDIATTSEMFDELRKWSAAHNGTGVILGEFGCVSAQPNATARALYFDALFSLAGANNVAPVIWSDNGLYMVYDDATRQFDQAVLGAIA